MPSPTKASSSSFFTVRTLHIACESLNQALRTPCSLARGLSPGPGNASLVPDRAVRLVDVPVRAEHQEPVERACEPAVVGDRQHGALERLQPRLQRLRAGQVEVVGWLVEQEERRSGQLQQQDLQPRLL